MTVTPSPERRLSLAALTPAKARAPARAGVATPTTGWATGYTQVSRPPFAITHSPGHMFVTDIRDDIYRLPSDLPQPAPCATDRTLETAPTPRGPSALR